MTLSAKQKITLLITVILIVTAYGCGNQDADKSYEHIKKARDYCDELLILSGKALDEYEQAHSLYSEEFFAHDYRKMSFLYWNKRDYEKFKEFGKKADDLYAKEEKTGHRERGFLMLP